MQPIERYGLIALVFLGITITAACLWEPEEGGAPESGGSAAAALAEAPGRGAGPASRDFVGARTQERRPQQGLTAEQRQRLLALQDAELAQVSGARGDAVAPPAGPDALQAQQASAEDEGALRRRLASGAADLLAAAGDTASGLAHRVRPEAEPAGDPPPPTARPASAPTRRTYVVRGGDTLSEIAQRELGTSKRWQEIVAMNPGLDPNRMRAGLRLVLPEGGAPAAERPAPAAAASAPPRETAPAKATYVVQRDDSLWKIAERALGDGGRWTEIAKLNPSIDPNRLKEGDRLALPGGASAAAKPAARRPETVASAAEPEPASGRRVR